MRLSNRSKIILVLFMLFVLPLVALGLSLLDKGRISVLVESGSIKEITYTAINKPNKPKNSNNSVVTVPRGEYSVQVILDDESVYYTQVTVKGYLRTTEVTARKGSFEAESISKDTAPFLVGLKGDSLVSRGNDQRLVYTSTSGNPSNIRILTDTIDPGVGEWKTLADGFMVGIDTSVDGVYLPKLYNTTTNELRPLEAFSYSGAGYGTSPVVINSGFALYNRLEESVMFYNTDIGQVKPTHRISTAGHTVAYRGGLPLYTASDEVIAFVEGETETSDDSVTDNEYINNARLVVTQDDSDEPQVIDLVTDSSIKGLSLSPSGAYIAVSSTLSLDIYSRASGMAVFSIPLSHDTVLWYGDELLFSVPGQGIFMASAPTREATNILPGSLVRVSNLSFIRGDVLFFSAFPGATKNKNYPDAFTLNLKKKPTDNNQLLSKLPIQTDSYKIDHYKKTIFIQATRYVADGVTVSIEGEQEARKLITYLFEEPERYAISIGYIDVDVGD